MLATFFDTMRSNLTLMALNSVSENDLLSDNRRTQGRCHGQRP